MERHTLGWFEKSLPEGFRPGLKATLALEGAIDDRAGMDAPTAVALIQGDVHHGIEDPERLAALWWSPHHRDADAWE
jgi:hypothetical protein